MKKLAIITTHPIQYNAPLFKLLLERGEIKIKVFYTWGEEVLKEKFDPGFGKTIHWDIPLLEGYDYCFVKNSSKNPGSHHFNGIDNDGLINDIEEYNPDSILIFGWSFRSHLKVLRHFYGKKKILFRGDSTLLNEKKGFSFKKSLRHIFLKWVYSHVNTALYVGSNNKKYYEKFGLKKNQLIFAPHAVENERFGNASETNRRQQMGIEENAMVFLFAGKLESKKNPILLLEAFLQSGISKAHLVFVGTGHLESDLKNKVMFQNEEKKRRIHFIDFANQSRMPGIYEMADVFVLPSSGSNETWGLAVNEAMACRKAVLVSDQCGCANDLVKEGINGYVFQSNNRVDLIVKMRLLSSQMDKLKNMGQQSFEMIQNWSFEKIAEVIEKAVK